MKAMRQSEDVNPGMPGMPGGMIGGAPMRARRVKETSLAWNVIGVISLVASVLLFVGVGLKEWRVSDQIILNRQSGVTRLDGSSYGLLLLQFGTDPSRTWSRMRQAVCSAVTANGIISQGGGIIGLNVCGDVCLGHYRTRCQVYQSFEFWGLLTIGILVLVGAAGLLASGWLFLFGPNATVFQILWLGGGLAVLSCIGAWVMITDSAFNQLGATSVFPYANLSAAAYLTIAAGFILLGCGVLSFVVCWVRERAKWKEKQEMVRQQMIMGDPYTSPFGGPPLGGPGGMPGQIPPNFAKMGPIGALPGGGFNTLGPAAARMPQQRGMPGSMPFPPGAGYGAFPNASGGRGGFSPGGGMPAGSAGVSRSAIRPMNVSTAAFMQQPRW